ncbi:MAG: DUF4123 domain-containing protein [Bacteroidetes bacterium]|nr:DUF4123 domain-containing protein [Bacteroidota bacterium]
MTLEKINYIVLDAARMDELLDVAIVLNKENLSLFSGKGEEYLKPVSPYLFSISQTSEFANWAGKIGWSHSWGIYLQTNTPFAEIYKHLRKLILVRTEEGEEMYFRFYDPRVLRAFLPTCYKDQLREFFGPIEKIICEDVNPDFALMFYIKNGELATEKIAASTVVDREASPLAEQKPDSDEKKDEPPIRKWRFIVE